MPKISGFSPGDQFETGRVASRTKEPLIAALKIHYFDSNATTSVAPEVLQAMLPYLTEEGGNPSSPYRLGKRLVEPIEAARGAVRRGRGRRVFVHPAAAAVAVDAGRGEVAEPKDVFGAAQTGTVARQNRVAFRAGGRFGWF